MQNIPFQYRYTVEKIVATMRKFLADGQELHAFAFLGKIDGRIMPMPMDTESGMSKDTSAYLVQLISKEFKPDFVIVVSEAWALMRENSPEDIAKFLKEHKSVSEHPDRQEIVLLNLETRHGIWMGTSPIKSLGDKSRGFDDMTFTESKNVQGRFAHFLPPESETKH